MRGNYSEEKDSLEGQTQKWAWIDRPTYKEVTRGPFERGMDRAIDGAVRLVNYGIDVLDDRVRSIFETYQPTAEELDEGLEELLER